MRQEHPKEAAAGEPPPPPAGGAPPELPELAGQARRGRLRRWLTLPVLALLAAAAAWYLLRNGQPPGPSYETAAVERGDLVVTVAATGTLQPTNQVDVGSELSGTVETVLVDDNSRVQKGQVLARLDTAKLEDQITNSRAALEVAEAGVRLAVATLDEADANLARLREVYRLSDGKVPSKAELETAEAAQARAAAGLASARAAVAQAQATLRTNEINLSKATIRSPIDGIVLLRQVEPGQTVAASLQAPVLFTLAEDLARMELQVKVDEADVGQVRDGQSALFTVDAYPNRRYPAEITRVSYGATTTDNVVTYLTVLRVDNDDLSLRPGMTASAEITTSERQGVLLVPNAALRFTPPRSSAPARQGLVASLVPRRPREEKTVRLTGGANAERHVWVLQQGQPTRIAVRTGATDGRMTEITEGALQPGMAVITGTAARAP